MNNYYKNYDCCNDNGCCCNSCCNPIIYYTGATGATGPTGPSKIGSAFLVKFDDNNVQLGIEVLSNERLPLDRL